MMETQFTLRDEDFSMLMRRANRLGVGLLALIVLTAGFVGCTTQSHIGEEVKKSRPTLPPRPGDKPYQTAIRNHLVQTLPDPDFEDVKWFAPAEVRDGLGVRFQYRAKRPGSNIKDLYDETFIYTKKGDVRNFTKSTK
jgi:hypothetical protein